MRLFLLTLLAFTVRLHLFLSSDKPTGWDGHFFAALHVVIPRGEGGIQLTAW